MANLSLFSELVSEMMIIIENRFDRPINQNSLLDKVDPTNVPKNRLKWSVS